MICVECGLPLRQVFREYSLGNIRLSRCATCNNIADKYIEFELVLIVIDMILHKIQVYRHLLFNRLPYTDKGIPMSVVKLAALLLLVDAARKLYVPFPPAADTDAPFLSDPAAVGAAAALSLGNSPTPGTTQVAGTLVHNITMWAAMESLLGSTLEWGAFVAGVVLATRVSPLSRGLLIKYNYLVIALVLSSFGNLLCVVGALWRYHPYVTHVISAFVFSSNVVGVTAFTQGSPWLSVVVLLPGYAAQQVVKYSLCLVGMQTECADTLL